MDILGQLYALDKSVLHAINLAGTNPFVDSVMVLLTSFGAFYFLPFIAIWPWLKGHKRLAFDIVVVVVIATIVSEALEFVIRRQRPFEVLADTKIISFYGLASASGYSFPSGHATRIFAVVTMFCLGRRLRFWMIGLSLAVLVGLSRIYLGLHWPSDILAGAVLGIVVTLALHWIARREGFYSDLQSRSIALLDEVFGRLHRPASKKD